MGEVNWDSPRRVNSITIISKDREDLSFIKNFMYTKGWSFINLKYKDSIGKTEGGFYTILEVPQGKRQRLNLDLKSACTPFGLVFIPSESSHIVRLREG